MINNSLHIDPKQFSNHSKETKLNNKKHQNNFSAEHQVLKFKMEVVLLDIGKYTGEINDDGRPHGKGSLR